MQQGVAIQRMNLDCLLLQAFARIKSLTGLIMKDVCMFGLENCWLVFDSVPVL